MHQNTYNKKVYVTAISDFQNSWKIKQKRKRSQNPTFWEIYKKKNVQRVRDPDVDSAHAKFPKRYLNFYFL